MKNNTNLYDIDGEIIRKAGDIHEITAEEARNSIEKYEKKLKDNPDDPKAPVYRSYIKNLTKYVFIYYQAHPEELNDALKQYSTSEKVAKAIEELKAEVDKEEAKETVMDEYVQFEELPVSGETSKQPEELPNGESTTQTSTESSDIVTDSPS